MKTPARRGLFPSGRRAAHAERHVPPRHPAVLGSHRSAPRAGCWPGGIRHRVHVCRANGAFRSCRS